MDTRFAYIYREIGAIKARLGVRSGELYQSFTH